MKESDFPLYIFHHGKNYKAYEFFGAHPEKREKNKGFVFRVWAPHAETVSVVGDSTTGIPRRTLWNACLTESRLSCLFRV